MNKKWHCGENDNQGVTLKSLPIKVCLHAPPKGVQWWSPASLPGEQVACPRCPYREGLTSAGVGTWRKPSPYDLKGCNELTLESIFLGLHSISPHPPAIFVHKARALVGKQGATPGWDLLPTSMLSSLQVLIPVFALGRAQELCILLETFW